MALRFAGGGRLILICTPKGEQAAARAALSERKTLEFHFGQAGAASPSHSS